MFVDEARITVAGGDGGNGCSSFRREKYVPRGGPDGGNGGKGGSVVLVADPNVSTLLEFRYRREFRADRGRHGQGSNKTGRSGQDRELRVPLGTVVLDEDGVRRLADLSESDRRFVAAQGGRGGRGNATFAGPTNRAPTRSEPGQPGQERTLRLELKLLADVGLLGFPNAGKSTLLSRISAARPKIADYPFTTLAPQLGVVDRGDFRSFVVADIPGLIEGAHEGAGLGLRFLRHVERCRLLLHLVDPTDPERDPVEGIGTLNAELSAYHAELGRRPQILVVTKADAVQEPDAVEAVRRHAEAGGQRWHLISAVVGTGLDGLIRDVSGELDRLAEPSPAADSAAAPPTVGVLGGTFDPVHLAHLAIAQHARRVLELDRMLLLPTGVPPHKPAESLSPVAHRVAMLRAAIEGRDDLELCSLEVDTDGVSYTYDTLCALRDGRPPCRPVFVLGMDALRDIESWHEWRRLLAEFDLAVIDRPERISVAERRLPPEVGDRVRVPPEGPARAGAFRELQPGLGGRVFLLPVEPMPISSSLVRERAAAGADLSGLVPPGVGRYIHGSRLYREEEDR